MPVVEQAVAVDQEEPARASGSGRPSSTIAATSCSAIPQPAEPAPRIAIALVAEPAAGDGHRRQRACRWSRRPSPGCRR